MLELCISTNGRTHTHSNVHAHTLWVNGNMSSSVERTVKPLNSRRGKTPKTKHTTVADIRLA